MPEGTGAILDTRSLATDHRRLAVLLRPGLASSTSGAAPARSPVASPTPRRARRALGVDVNASMIDKRARSTAACRAVVAVADVHALPTGAFDIVTAARVLQWLAEPAAALRRRPTRRGRAGVSVVLDYNHEKTAWTPAPPESMARFYAAFLRWRAGAGMDNAIADHLPELFARVGLSEIVAKRSARDHATRRPRLRDARRDLGRGRATRGHQMVADGAISEQERRPRRRLPAWLRDGGQTHVQYLRAVEACERSAPRAPQRVPRGADAGSSVTARSR